MRRRITEDLERILFSFLGLVVAFIPLWLYFVARAVLTPKGFWQNFLLLGAGFYFLGIIQVILLVTLGVFLWAVWENK